MGQRAGVRWWGLLFFPGSMEEDNRAMGLWVVKRLGYKTESLHAKWMLI